MAAGLLRFVGAPLAGVLTGAPRRQLNLPRWTGGREFRHVHAASVAWMDSHFELIERGAPWLRRVGSDVWDYCRGAVMPFFRLTPGFSATAGCTREVTAVYGCDDPLIPRLRTLGQALPPAGWELGTAALPQTWMDLDPDRAAAAEGLASHRTSWMTDRQVTLSWRPTEALDFPPDGEGTPPWQRPPLTPHMRVTWSSRGQATGWRPDPGKTSGATLNYLPLEVSQAHVPDLLDQALARYDHALTVTIILPYYSNPTRRRGRTGYRAT